MIRNELSAAERAIHIAQRKKLYEQMQPETKNGKHPNRAKQHRKPEDRQVGDLPDRFTADTAVKTGTSERAIQRDAARGAKIKNIEKVIGTSLDKGEAAAARAGCRGNP